MIVKNNHFLFLFLPTAPMFIKHKAQGQFHEGKNKKQLHTKACKHHAGCRCTDKKTSGTVLTSRDVMGKVKKLHIRQNANNNSA